MAEAKTTAKKGAPYSARLKQQFNTSIRNDLKRELGLKSVEEARKIRKIIVS